MVTTKEEPITVNTFTKTEALRRVRLAAALARTVCGRNQKDPVEIGLRTNPVRISAKPTTADEAMLACYPNPDDDLREIYSLTEYARYFAQPGDVVHMYVKEPCGGGHYEPFATICLWLGDADNEPQVIHPNYVRY